MQGTARKINEGGNDEDVWMMGGKRKVWLGFGIGTWGIDGGLGYLWYWRSVLGRFCGNGLRN
jgi:hypothetical protein